MKIHRQDVIKFEYEGHPFEAKVTRLTALQQLDLNLAFSELSDIEDEFSAERTRKVYKITLDILATVTDDLKGFEDLDGWPKEIEERKRLLDLAGVEFLTAYDKAYGEATRTSKGEEDFLEDT